jgi:hypothetical protein
MRPDKMTAELLYKNYRILSSISGPARDEVSWALRIKEIHAS